MCDQTVSQALCPPLQEEGLGFFFGPKTNDPQKLNTKLDKRTSQALKGAGGVQNGCSYYFLEEKMLASMEKQQL